MKHKFIISDFTRSDEIVLSLTITGYVYTSKWEKKYISRGNMCIIVTYAWCIFQNYSILYNVKLKIKKE